jgi:Tfp pilus assembly protein PilF
VVRNLGGWRTGRRPFLERVGRHGASLRVSWGYPCSTTRRRRHHARMVLLAPGLRSDHDCALTIGVLLRRLVNSAQRKYCSALTHGGAGSKPGALPRRSSMLTICGQRSERCAGVGVGMEALVLELPAWLNVDFIMRVLDSKVFSAIYWGSAAVVAVVGFIARLKYRKANLKKLLNAYVETARQAEGRERESVKEAIKRAADKARGLANGRPFDPSKVFEDAARMFAQRQPDHAIQILVTEAGACEATIEFAKHRVRLCQERAATAHLEIGMIHRHQGQGLLAVEAFTSMLRVNPGDLDAFQMRGTQYRDLGRFTEAEGDFRALEYHVAEKPAAVADVKPELGAVFLGSGDYPRAESVLNDAMKIEEQLHSQRGIALTHESLGTVLTARKWWKQARRSYQDSKVIFNLLDDQESVDRVDKLVQGMIEARNQELRRRREKQRRVRRQPTVEHAPVLH